MFFTKDECPKFHTIAPYLTSKYYSDINYYHTIHHIYDMLNLAYIEKDEIKKHCDIDLFLIAILGHDCFYKTACTENEKNSAVYTLKLMDLISNQVKIEVDDKKFVEDLILSTKFGENIDTEAKKILHDFDYWNLQDYYAMKLADKQIVNEAIRDGFSLNDVISGRRNFYNEIMKSDIFLCEKNQPLNFIAKCYIKKILNN